MLIKRVGIVIMLCFCALAAQAQFFDDFLQDIDNNLEAALEILNEALDDFPDMEEQLLRIRAAAYEDFGQYQRAIDDYTRLTQLEPDDESLWYSLGRNQFMNGQLPEAMRSLNTATRLNSRFLPAFHTKTEILLQLNDYEAASRMSDSTFRIAETATSYYLLGEVYSGLRQWQRAQWAYSSAVRIDRGYINAYIASANIAADLNQALEAIEAAEAALRIDPDSKEALIARSRGLAIMRDYTNAIDDVSYVIDIDPNNTEARLWRGTYYLETNRIQDAIRDLDAILRLQPDHIQATARRAEAIFELRRENRPPVLTLTDPLHENFEILIPQSLQSITIRGKISDESPIKSLTVNGQAIPIAQIGDELEFVALVALENITEIRIEVSDVYDNTTTSIYRLVRYEELSEN